MNKQKELEKELEKCYSLVRQIEGLGFTVHSRDLDYIHELEAELEKCKNN